MFEKREPPAHSVSEGRNDAGWSMSSSRRLNLSVISTEVERSRAARRDSFLPCGGQRIRRSALNQGRAMKASLGDVDAAIARGNAAGFADFDDLN